MEEQEEEDHAYCSNSTVPLDHGGISDSAVVIKVEEEDGGDQNIGVLKREISCHFLYGSLLESHLDCLKLCGDVEIDDEIMEPSDHHQTQTTDHHQAAELDQFMEAYCMMLKELKESMEEPQQESMAFIEYMYSQLHQICNNNNNNVDIAPSSCTVSTSTSSVV